MPNDEPTHAIARAPRLMAEDAGLIVLDKPAGFAVHPVREEGVPDLLTWVKKHLGAPAELAPIHRIDRETSGLVLCSADSDLRARLGLWFSDGEVEKRYLALVQGRARRKGIIRRRLKDPRRRRPVEAITRYKRLLALGPTSHLEVHPLTGRRHQIRRHLQGLGLPVVGDHRYPPRRFAPIPGFPGRLWLHAHRLVLPDGRRFESPLPPELARHLELLTELRRDPSRP